MTQMINHQINSVHQMELQHQMNSLHQMELQHQMSMNSFRLMKSLGNLSPLNRNVLSLSGCQKQSKTNTFECQILSERTLKHLKSIKSYDELEEENKKLKQEINKLHKTMSTSRSESCHCQGSTSHEYIHPKNNILCVERAGILFDCNQHGMGQGYVCNGNLEQCLHLSRLTKIINQYINGNIKHIQTINITMILNNFIHLLQTHDTNSNFESIANTFGFCDIMNCKIFVRNYRIRQTNELITDENHDKYIVYKQILDKIHCFYCHCFDIGNKICS
eukprot:453270_1